MDEIDTFAIQIFEGKRWNRETSLFSLGWIIFQLLTKAGFSVWFQLSLESTKFFE